MTTTRKCSQCGAEMAETTEGLCPACLLKGGMATEGATKTGTGGSSGNVPDVQEVAKRFPQLEIIELLGAGGMGVVYKARQPQLDRLVALKLLPAEAGRDPAFAERFAREARALAKLNHPNIVAVYDFGQVDEFYYFIMEFVDGANLRQMERAGKLTAAEALTIVPKICDALQYAHEEGIVHRDIKPENILVDKKGRVKIADFGLAKLLGKERTDFTLTGTNQAMGTPHYMAPEQMEKPLSVDHRADIYSLGVVFYEMLTGELPLGRFQPPSAKVHVDVRLDEVVLRSMERDVERRYQHVSEMKTAVEGVTSTPQAPVAPPVVATAKPGTNWVKIVLIVVGSLLMIPVVIGLLIFMLYYSAKRTSSTRSGPYVQTSESRPVAFPGDSNRLVTYRQGHTAPVTALAVSGDGRWLVSAGLDGQVVIGDLEKTDVVLNRIADKRSYSVNKLRCVTMTRDGRSAFVGGDLGASLLKVRLDSEDTQLINVPNERGATIHTVMACSDANRIAYITTGDKEIVFYDIAQKRVIAKAPIPGGQTIGHVGRVAVSPSGNPNGRFIAVTSCNMVPGKNGPNSFESADPCKLTVFNEQGVECLSWQFPNHADFLNAQVVFPKNVMLAVCLPSGKMLRWTQYVGDKWQPEPTPLRIPPGRYTASAAHWTGNVIWLAEGPRIIGIDAETGSELGSVELKIGERRGADVDAPIQALACPEGNKVAAALWDGRVAVANCELRPLLIPGTVLKSFDTSDPVIATNLVVEGNSWFANCATPQTLRLFELPNPGVDDCIVTYRAQLNTKELKGRAYLEMWCRLPGEGEFFGRGLNNAVVGGKNWWEGEAQTTQTEFLLKPGQRPDLIKLNLVVEGTGRVGIRFVEVRKVTPNKKP